MAEPTLSRVSLHFRALSEARRRSGRLAAIPSTAVALAGVLLVGSWLLFERHVPGAYYEFGEVLVTLLAGVAGFTSAWLGRSALAAAERAHRASERELATRDGLSGLYNYHYLHEAFHSELARAERDGATCAVARIDLDDFQDINERFGNHAGDAFIAAVGAAMQDLVGEAGMVARHGGDEFAIVLPGFDRDRAETFAARVASRISDVSLTVLPGNRHTVVSASCGIAVYPDDGPDTQTVFAAAGRALYAAKAQRLAVRERADERRAQDVFFAIGQAMGSLDPAQRVRNLVNAVGASLDLDACTIWLVQPDDQVKIRAHYTSTEDLPVRFARVRGGQPMTLDEARECGLLGVTPVYADDVATSNVLPERFRDLMPPGSWCVSVPLLSPRQGVLMLIATHQRCAPPGVSVVSAIARLAAAALRNSDDYARTRRQADMLSALAGVGGLLFGDGDFDDRLEAVVRRIAGATGYDMVTLDTGDPTGQRQFIRRFYGRSPDGSEVEPELRDAWLALRPTMTDRSVAGFLSTLREPIVMENPSAEAPEAYRQFVADSGTRSAVVVPVIWQGELKGLFYFSSRTENAFDEHDVALMQTIAAQLAPSLQVAALHVALESSYASLRESHRDSLQRLAFAAEARDPYTGRHLQRIGALSEAIARRMGYDDDGVEAIGYAAIVHDLGKLRIPDSILNKPGELTQEDWTIMRRHPQHGAELLGTGFLYDAARTVALHHHERWDGSGYPFGLMGEDIPLEARIVSVADVYDALISARPYKPAWSRERALAELLQMRARTLCPRSVDVFLSLWGEGVIARIESETQDSSFEADFRERYADAA